MKHTRKTTLLWGTLTALLVLLVLVGGSVWLYFEQRNSVKNAAVERLGMIGKLKALEISKWRQNIIADAAIYADSPGLRRDADRFLAEPTAENAQPVMARFASLQAQKKYYDVLLVDSGGISRLSLSGRNWHRDGYAAALAAARRQNTPTLTDLHVDETGGVPHLSVVAPLSYSAEDAGASRGALVLVDAAGTFLFPQLKAWPSPAKSAETFIVRRDGGGVLYMSPLKHKDNVQMRLSVPLDAANVPSVQAVLGRRGVVEGVDYRGVPVLAYVQPVHGSEWFMVAKQDRHEIFAEWRQRSRLIIIFWAALAVCVILTGVALRYRSQRSYFHDLYQAETRLRKDAEQSSVTLRAIGDAVIVTDADGCVEMLNPAAVSMTGWEESDARGRPLGEIFAVIDAKTRKPLASPIERVLQRGKTITFGAFSTLVAKNGQEVPIADSVAPVRDGNGRITGIVLVFRDLTLERNYGTLFQRMLNGFALHEVIYDDAGRTVDFRFVDINPAFEAMTGWQRDRVVGRTVVELLPDTDLVWIEKMCSVVGSGENIEFEDYARHFDKNFRVSVFSTGPRQFAAIYLDVTEQRRAEKAREELWEQLLQAQKVESVGRLAGGVAHDFNNMLGVILGNAELALDALAPDAPVRTEIAEIMKAGQRAADVTRQLLAFARKQIISPKVLDINDTLEGMLKMLRSLIGENVEIVWKPGGALATVKIDPAQLHQVLANLCLNARDAIEDVGRIIIETSMVYIDDEYCIQHVDCEPGGYVVVAVSDNGCGMSPETLSHLFEPFFTTKALGVGTGLGLSTVHGIVKQNNGFISVYSEPGIGTTFKIHLPPTAGELAQSGALVSAQIPRGRGETVMVVEDDPAILSLAALMLEAIGYTVVTAQTPEMALKIAATYSGAIRMVLTDVIMPAMNGHVLLRKLKELRPEIKGLFMSGYTANVIAHHGVLDPNVFFIHKPFSKYDLAVHVRQVLES